MKYIISLLLFFNFANAQTDFVKVIDVDCNEGTIIKKGQDISVKHLVFHSSMLPMSYDSKLTVYEVKGTGTIVSPSSVTSRRPKENESEPILILMGTKEEFADLKIGKFVKVTYIY